MAELFLIRKGGYYYRPNAQGYTASVHEAGRYPEAEAVAHMEACDPGEIVIFPAPAISASIPVEEDIKLTAEKIVLEHVASGTMNMNNLAAAIASALEKERSAAAAPAPVKHVIGFETNKSMLTSFGATSIREGSRMCFGSGDEKDEWEGYYEVPFHVLDGIREALSRPPSPHVEGFFGDLLMALSRLAGNRNKDGVSSTISREDRETIINGCHDLMIVVRQAPAPEQHVEGVEPDEWQYFCDGKWRHSTNPTYHRDTGYPMRPLYAISPSPQPNVRGYCIDCETDTTVIVDAPHTTCERCQGNGEIVTDWDRYMRGHEDENGNEAVAECPECGGEGIIDATPAPQTNVEGELHPDDLAVDRFAAAMKAKLAEKRDEGRGGWDDKDDCSQLFLSQLLREHVEKGDPLDVGNFAMMLHQREERISSLLETLQGE
jgi:hypothetical protein